MPLEIEYSFGAGITVPYGTIYDTIRRNRGFVDTRLRPDIAAKIAEGADCAALRDLLIDVASRSQYFSLGCDLGEHKECDAPASRRFVAGGYLQLSGFRYELQKTENYDRFCEALASQMNCLCKGACWQIRFEGTWVSFRLPGEQEVTKPSVQIWFFTAARSRIAATKSRERLLKALAISINRESVFKCLCP